MTNIKIEELNFIKTKGFWWVIAFGWIPIVNLLLIFSVFSWKIFGLTSDKINRAPFLLVFSNKKIDNTSFWGILYLVFAGLLTVGFAFAFVFVFEYRELLHFWLFVVFVAFPPTFIGILLFSYNARHQQYLTFVNNFLNNVMLKEQQDGKFDSLVYLNNPKEVHADTVLMIKDLVENNVLSIEDDMIRNRKIIVFTREFQQVLENNAR
jgi:hypothetical protein